MAKNIKVIIDVLDGGCYKEPLIQYFVNNNENPIMIYSNNSYYPDSIIDNKLYYYFDTSIKLHVPLLYTKDFVIHPRLFVEQYQNIVREYEISPTIYIDNDCKIITPIDEYFEQNKHENCHKSDCYLNCGLFKAKDSKYSFKDFLNEPKNILETICKENDINADDISFEIENFIHNINFISGIIKNVKCDDIINSLEFDTLIFKDKAGMDKDRILPFTSNIQNLLANYNDYNLEYCYIGEDRFIKDNLDDIIMTCENNFLRLNTPLTTFTFAISEVSNKENYNNITYLFSPEKNNNQENNNINILQTEEEKTPEIDVSIVIPYYNTNDAIRKCIHQNLYYIKNTDYTFEVLMICDASDDEDLVKEELKDLEDVDIKYFNTGVNLGPGGARNLGIEKAQGKRVLFVDDDDLIVDKCLIKHIAETKGDALFIPRVMPKYYKAVGGRIVLSLDFIKKYELKFLPLAKEEDSSFFYIMNNLTTDKKELPTLGFVYNYAIDPDNPTNVCSTGDQSYGIFNAFLSAVVAFNVSLKKTIKYKDKNILIELFNTIKEDYRRVVFGNKYEEDAFNKKKDFTEIYNLAVNY